MGVDHELAEQIQADLMDAFGKVTAGLDRPEATPETIAQAVMNAHLARAAETVVKQYLGWEREDLVLEMVAGMRRALRETWANQRR